MANCARNGHNTPERTSWSLGPSCTARLVPILDHSDGATDGATVESPARARPSVCAINEPRGTLDSGHNTGTVHAERLLTRRQPCRPRAQHGGCDNMLQY